MGLILERDSDGFERVVLGEVLIPDTANVYGDVHTKDNVREFAYQYMATMGTWYLDREHDGESIDDRVVIVESFIAREGDKDFVEGSWVLGTWIRDDEIWQQVVDGELNGYSWEALVASLSVEITTPSNRFVYGYTEPAVMDPHRHRFLAILDVNGRVIAGGTSFDDGHSHAIRTHTFTELADDHLHIFNVVQ